VRVEVTHPGRVMFPDPGITKDELVAYYERIAEWMLPHVRDRPVSMQRFPDGIEGEGFFHKDVPDYFPDWIKRAEVAKRGGSVTHALICDADTLAYLANQNCVTPHVWLSRSDRIRQPDRMVFDLDPSVDDFPAVRRAARAVGELLRQLGLEPFAMVTGSRGVHLWVPLRRGPSFPEVRDFAGEVGALLADRHPDELTMEFRKAKRGERLLIDVNRNAYAQTAVPPYAVRPRPGAPVATPLEWDELSDSKLRPDRWSLRNVLRRLAAKGDPWAGMSRRASALGGARKRFEQVKRRH
jgi:bifunctional non-homologous end joining protein LigD